MNGLFIAVEGIDGGGKSTLTRALAERLAENGFVCVRTGEPTDMDTGKILRERLRMLEAMGAVAAAIDAEYFVADRIRHNAVRITPALQQGAIVISDRYDLGTLAYQSVQGLPIEYLQEKRNLVIRHKLARAADLYLIVDLPAEIALQRLEARGRARDKFEDIQLLSKLRDTYGQLARGLTSPYAIIDGTKDPKGMLDEAYSALMRHVGLVKEGRVHEPH